MTANVEFRKLESKLRVASLEKDKIKILEALLEIDPSYPGLSAKRTGYREMLENLKRKKDFSKRGPNQEEIYALPSFALRNLIVGTPNAGKSTLLNRITGSNAAVADYPYTTFKPEIGMLVHGDINIQLVDLPAINEGDYEMQPKKYELIRSGRGLALVVKEEKEIREVLQELTKAGMKLLPPADLFGRERERETKAGFVIYRGEIPKYTGLPLINFEDEQAIRNEFYNCLGVVRVYPIVKGRKDETPFVLESFDTSVDAFARKIDKNYRQRFSAAKVWGNSVRQVGQLVDFNHKLHEGDTVNLIK
jgi:ribosome-interacting GTPase 1